MTSEEYEIEDHKVESSGERRPDAEKINFVRQPRKNVWGNQRGKKLCRTAGAKEMPN